MVGGSHRHNEITAAGLSPRSVSDLERGVTQTARKDTARLLAATLL